MHLKGILKAKLHASGQNGSLDVSLNDYSGVFVRAGGGELHVISSILGGIASQEAIKLLTAQFVPLKGTLIYNGIACTSSVLTL